MVSLVSNKWLMKNELCGRTAGYEVLHSQNPLQSVQFSGDSDIQ